MIKNNNSNKVLIFGSSGDIGIEICKIYLKNNFNVCYVCRDKNSYKKIYNKLFLFSKKLQRNSFEGIISKKLNETALIKILKKADKNQPLRVIVNSIGVFGYDEIVKFNTNKFLEFIKINTMPTILLNKILMKIRYKKRYVTNILTIGSSLAYEGFEKTISYSASKHALLSSIKSINKETYKNKIFNTLINPGSVKSRMGRKIKNQLYSSFINPADVAELVYGISMIKSPGIIEDVFYKRIIK
tara:strand:+ start:63 stop:791 length:729 start_codon:yes stop_codon:yes gene_type:complete